MDININTTYKQIAGFDTPNPMQIDGWQRVINPDWRGIGLLLKGPTGSGKTETFAVPCIASNKRLIMVYPTRSLVDDQIKRFSTMLGNQSQHNGGKITTLTIDTGAQSQRTCWRNGEEITPMGGRVTRHLYYGDVIITTLDKFIYRFFGYGEPNKSYIFPFRIKHSRPLICFDEAHSYEDHAFTNFQRLVHTLYKRGNDVALMTATLPKPLARSFEMLDLIDYVDDEINRGKLATFDQARNQIAFYPEKQLHYLSAAVDMDEDSAEIPPAITQIAALAAEKYDQTNRVIAIIESVKDAVAVFQQLRHLPNVKLYHGRLTHQQRTSVYEFVKKQDENGRYLLITTSAIEVGCDLNAHIMISQLCDPDKLVQRAGRCNRKLNLPNAELWVVGDKIPEWLTALSDPQPYITMLRKMHEQPFAPADLLPFLDNKTPEHDPRIETLFEMLYDYVYNARLEYKKLHETGVVVTRSWEPTVTLHHGWGDRNRPNDALSVPISRCRIPSREEPNVFLNLTIARRVYSQTTEQYELESLSSWQSGYTTDMFIDLPMDDFDPELGYVTLPKLFKGPYRQTRAGRRIIIREEPEASETKRHIIWYVDPDGTTLHQFEDLSKADDQYEREAS